MRKSNVITVNDISIEFSNMGLFDSETPWIHPTTTINTHELILVVNGEVHIREGAENYHLKKGDLLRLDKHFEHGGIQPSYGHSSFYWLHFDCNDVEKLGIPKLSSTDLPLTERAMKEIVHLQQQSKLLAELTFAKFLFTLSIPLERKNKLAFEIAEFIRIHRDKPLSVKTVAQRFGYTPEYLTRLLKKEFGEDMQTLILRRRIEYLEALLLNTDDSIQDISKTAGFDSANCFVKFFKYHTNVTPTNFRNQYFHLHMNKK